MKLRSISLVIVFLAMIVSCKKDKNTTARDWTNNIEALYQYNTSKVTITQGIAGTLTMRSGNCMPIVDPNGDCKEYPIRRFIHIYSYAKDSNVVKDNHGFYTQVNTTFYKKVESDDEGFFQAELNPGTYSVFIEEQGRFYANSYDGFGGINPVTIIFQTVSKVNQVIDYAVY